MPSGNVDNELRNSGIGIPSTVPRKLINVKNATYGKICILMLIAGDPDTYATATQGYTKDFSVGCVAIDTVTPAVHVNTGTVAAPSWLAQA